MFLRRVTLSGFKSFCDRVDFDFGPGVTCIVGPNGCGKSNVVDALKWVLGEQSARSLRGRQMIDMIFGGSSSRKGSSVAQVDITFDNHDRALPLDQDEITVSRRLYRSAESEYLINQQPVRLKDVREAFLDTGVGIDAYSIIEQGKVDSLLQSNPVDRRVIFEEAAGISRYKFRRHEAERKLERTQQNLLRLGDVMEELERRLRSVKLQAGKARSHQEYSRRLGELRSVFALAEYHRLVNEREELLRDIQVRSEHVVSTRGRIDEQDAACSALTVQLDDLAESVHRTEARSQQLRSDVVAQAERRQASLLRIEEHRVMLSRAGERAETARRRSAESTESLAEVRREADSIVNRIQELRQHIDFFTGRDETLARELTVTQVHLEEEKAGTVELVRRSAQLHNEIVRLNARFEALVEQKSRVSSRDGQVLAELEQGFTQQRMLGDRLHEIETLITEESRRLEEKRESAARVGDVCHQLLAERAGLKERRSALRSRLELLLDLERRREGVGGGAKALLETRDDQRERMEESPIVGLVADIMETDVAHAPVVEAVLGEWDQVVVARRQSSLLRILASLDGQLSGRVTAVCLDRCPPVINEPDVIHEPGTLARVEDLVRTTPEFEPLVRYLMRKTILVDSLETALRLSSRDVSAHRFVTPRGELLEPDGRIALGGPSASAGLVARKSEIRDAQLQLTQIDERISSLTDQVTRTEAEMNELDLIQQELRTGLHQAQTAGVEVRATIHRIDEDVRRLTSEQPLLRHEITVLEHEMGDLRARLSDGERSAVDLDRQNREREARIVELQSHIDLVVEQRRALQNELTEARVSVGQLTEKRAAISDRAHALTREIQAADDALRTSEDEVTQNRTRIDELVAAAAAAAQSEIELQGQLDQSLADGEKLRRDRDAQRLDLDARLQQIKTCRTELNERESALHEVQMRSAEQGVRLDELVARTREELGTDLPDAYPKYLHQDQDWQQVEADIVELRGKIERLGHVNLDALTELDELEQRHNHLSGQQSDLTQSLQQLQQLIDRLNAESRDRFLSAFEQIREHFRAMFRKLFGGGRADIVLEDPQNMLECGVEIVAQPPGKELQVISLMSGGEKSMTAIALLMSIFKSRPAPFAILDEVDAALDEANNDRFNRIVKDFVSQSQFIIITHSRWTMNIADRLYGVTMQEPGVSTRVSVELPEAQVA